MYFGALRRQRRAVLTLGAWSLVEGIPPLLTGNLVSSAVDDGFAVHRPWTGMAWIAAFGVFAVVGAVGTRLSFGRLGDVVEPLRDELVAAVVRGVLHGDPHRHHQADAGAVARITRHIEVVRDVTAGLLVQVRALVVTTIAALVGLVGTAGGLTGFVLPPVLVALGLFGWLLGTIARRQRDLVLSEERCAQAAGTAANGIRDVVACGAEYEALAEISAAVDAQATASVQLGRAGALRTLVLSLGGIVPLVLVFLVAPGMVARGALTAGALYGAVVYLTTSVQPALIALGQTAGSTVLRLVVTLRRLAEVSRFAPEYPVHGQVPNGGDLILRGITFGWGADAEPVVRDLSLELPFGEHLAIVGASGIGKSTVAGLLCGLLCPDSGTVRLGGVPVTGLDPMAVALIPQEAYVFTGTLRENLALLTPDADDQTLLRAATAVGARDLVDRLGGLSAAIGHEGASLSGADRQLVALARVFACPARIVILDEATSSLDPASEARAERAFAARGGTLVVIAHRLSSARRAGQVLVMGSGRPVLGRHAELLTESGDYAELMRAWDPRAVPSRTSVAERYSGSIGPRKMSGANCSSVEPS